MILGNYIGLGRDGLSALGNGQCGILVVDADKTLIGSGYSAEGNVISANGAYGIRMIGNADTKIYGNLVGTDVSGLVAKGNKKDGIRLEVSQRAQVGKAGAYSRNIISGNEGYGIEIEGSDNVVANNYIGLGSDGSTNLGNTSGGVVVYGMGSEDNTIGGASYDLGNVISASKESGGPSYGNGILIAGNTSATTVAANTIGTDAAEFNEELGNARSGIYIETGSIENIIGLAGAYNLIAENGGDGIEADGTDNTIDFNYVGLNAFFDEMPNGGSWRSGSIANNTWGTHNFHN